MDTIVHPMSMDIGFGDVVTPCPTTIEFPILLDDIPSITIQAYSIETVIAEKFHAMIVRDVSNSRMKDFFDCFQLLTTGSVDEAVLYDAIKATFDNRKIEYNADLQLFSESFYSDAQRLQRWNVFLKKIQWKAPIDFKYVMNIITNRLQGLYNLYWTEKHVL